VRGAVFRRCHWIAGQARNDSDDGKARNDRGLG